MSRAMVIDRCVDCPYITVILTTEGWTEGCYKTSKKIDLRSPDWGKAGAPIPDWCPLRPLPERLEENYEHYDCGYADGWNDCLDAIEGDRHD